MCKHVYYPNTTDFRRCVQVMVPWVRRVAGVYRVLGEFLTLYPCFMHYSLCGHHEHSTSFVCKVFKINCTQA